MTIKNEQVDEFLNRFYSFYDSIIRNLNISFRNSLHPTKIEIVISCKDRNLETDDAWVNVTLEIFDVTEFSFYQSGQEDYQVISNGIHILYLDETYYFDFGYHIDKPDNVYELKESKFYVAGKELKWNVSHYQELY